ncbi:hypothetical protein T09_1325 [Trichinella sp. T9]|nr:hypothetical protein T09_1325 [Trichinella sp. T9]
MNSQLILNYRGRAWYLFESLAESTISIFLLISQEMHIHERSGYTWLFMRKFGEEEISAVTLSIIAANRNESVTPRVEIHYNCYEIK